MPKPSPETRTASLYDVMDRRRSQREPSETPARLDQIAAVLWAVARYRQDRFAITSETALRNVPGGGAKGEIEYYLAVNRCEGLQRGFYFYDGAQHALAPIPCAARNLDALLDDAASRLLIEESRPDCVLVLSCRLARLLPKYHGVAYRLSVLHVGVAYEALYLAATAEGLSPCAIGFADSAHFTAITGLDPMEECSIGEFALSGPGAASDD